jgi:uncharacterized protein (TIGR03435 family)
VAGQRGISLHGNDDCDPFTALGADESHIREGLVSALGLKLQSGKKAQVEVLVIDQVERPDAN